MNRIGSSVRSKEWIKIDIGITWLLIHSRDYVTRSCDQAIRVRIYNILYISLLEQNNIKKKYVIENKIESNVGNNNKKFKIEIILNSMVYARK